jgi:hypothetical protein
MHKFAGLFGNRCGDCRMSVTEVADTDTGGKVQKFIALAVIEPGTFAVGEILCGAVSLQDIVLEKLK